MAVSLLLAALALSCERNEAPEELGGEIVLRFEPGASPGALMRASVFDSVVVNVFRSGSSVRLEASHGVGIHDELHFRRVPSDFLRVSHRSTCKRRVTSDYRLLLVTMVWRGDENWGCESTGA